MPKRKYQHWTIEEYAIIEFCRKRNDSWASIAARLPGRTVIDCKAIWYKSNR